ncbi:MAG: o-succinylbenzoate synthase [bacterium]|jgi:O-succinylbenzoate synthase
MSFRIERVRLRQIRLPLVQPFETSFGRTTERRILLVEVLADGISGWGEVTASEHPFYNEEWTESAWLILLRYAAPRLLGRELSSAADAAPLLKQIRRHRMARGGIEAAVWDLEARLFKRPLWRHIGGVKREIPCGVSIGIQPSIDALLTKIETELAAGYQRIKVKIKPGWDVHVLAEIRRRFPGIRLMADANSAYTLADAEHLRRLDEFNLMMLEQPLGHDEIIDHAELQAMLQTPLCLDESIRTAHHADQAIRMRACKIINIKLGRVGGFAEARRVHAVAYKAGVPVWCGGMLESGVGRAHNVALSTLPGFVLPGDVSASKRYWTSDIIYPPIDVTPRGTIVASDKPGFGYEIDAGVLKFVTERREELAA